MTIIIHPPTIRHAEDTVELSAEIESRHGAGTLPDRVWYRFARKYAEGVSERCEPFAVALLPSAMKLHEDLQPRGPLSPKLAFGLREYQRIVNFWRPRYRVIDLQPERVAAPPPVTKAGTATAFSGGVDSFYTLHAESQQRASEPQFRLSHAVFILGFDLPSDDNPIPCAVVDSYRGLMQELGMELITVETNLRHYLKPWTVCHGCALASVAHALPGVLKRFYVPSSYSYAELHPWGSHPLLDHHLSSEVLDIVHHGADASRTAKTVVLSDWPPAHDRLLVCWTPEGLQNCCRCDKCHRTMLALEMVGALPRFSTFRKPVDFDHYRRSLRTPDQCLFAKDVQNLASQQGRRDVTLGLRNTLWRAKLMQRAKQLMRPWVRRFRRSETG